MKLYFNVYTRFSYTPEMLSINDYKKAVKQSNTTDKVFLECHTRPLTKEEVTKYFKMFNASKLAVDSFTQYTVDLNQFDIESFYITTNAEMNLEEDIGSDDERFLEELDNYKEKNGLIGDTKLKLLKAISKVHENIKIRYDAGGDPVILPNIFIRPKFKQVPYTASTSDKLSLESIEEPLIVKW